VPARRATRPRPDARSAPAVLVRVLDRFELSVDGRPVLLARGSQRLAAYLAIRGATARGRVAGELWPDTSQAQAMSSLRTAVWRTNRATVGLVSAVGDILDLQARAEVDVRQVLRSAGGLLITPTSPARAAPPPVELLPSWDDEWLVHDRERVRQLQLHALEAGAQRLLGEGAFGLALDWAYAAVRAEPLRESAHRMVVAIHLAEGNITEARRAYDGCADLLQRELGVRPSVRTEELMLSAGGDRVVTAR
jgi:DNA-binding SARP family transcriptional activator